jgi:magnesium transporter
MDSQGGGAGKPLITLIRYDAGECSELRPRSAAEVASLLDGPPVKWLNVEGLGDPGLIRAVCARFELHPLLVDDILNTTRRARVEELGDVMFVCLKMLQWDEAANAVRTEHVSLLLARDTVVSFQETPGDVFGRIRERLAAGGGRARQMGSDYLLYSLIDAVVDEHFFILEQIEERVEALEEGLLENPDTERLQDIHRLRREVIGLGRAIWPMRELVSRLERSESPLLSGALRPFVRDLYDHTIQVHEAFESLREIVASVLEVYLSSVNNRLNGVMKYLTLISTIFIPMTFVTGLYGMNFRFMPELGSPWGYPAALAVMACVAAGTVFFFRRRKWF